MSISYQEIKEKVMDNQFTTKKLPVKDIEYLNDDVLLIKNVPIKADNKLNKSLLIALGVRPDVVATLNKVAPEMTRHYMDKARASKELNNIEIILNSEIVIKAFNSDSNGVMPGEVFMGIIDRLMNTSGGMEIESVITKDDGTVLNIIDNHSEVDLFKTNGGEKGKEIFKFGTTLSTTIEHPLEFNQFSRRLWCTNGCSTSIDEKSFYIGKISPESIWNFMSKFEGFQGTGYGRSFFEGFMQSATSTPASIQEVLDVYGNLVDKIGDGEAYQLLPVGHLYKDYARAGVDLSKATRAQKKTAVSNYTVWEVFNALTNAASNYGIIDANMQIKAGALLAGERDIANVMSVNPYSMANIIK